MSQNNQLCEMCKYFISYIINKIYELKNYYLCIKQKVNDDINDEDEIEEHYKDDISDHDEIEEPYIPGPYDDVYNDQWNHVSYDGYHGYDN